MGNMDRSEFGKLFEKKDIPQKLDPGSGGLYRRDLLLTTAGVLGAATAALTGYGVSEHYKRKLDQKTEALKAEIKKFKDTELKEIIKKANEDLGNIENKVKKFQDDSRKRGSELDAFMVNIPDNPQEPELIDAYEQLFFKYSIARILHKNLFTETQKEFSDYVEKTDEMLKKQDHSDTQNPLLLWEKGGYSEGKKRIEKQMKSFEQQYKETGKKFADFLSKIEEAIKKGRRKPEDRRSPTRLV